MPGSNGGCPAPDALAGSHGHLNPCVMQGCQEAAILVVMAASSVRQLAVLLDIMAYNCGHRVKARLAVALARGDQQAQAL